MKVGGGSWRLGMGTHKGFAARERSPQTMQVPLRAITGLRYCSPFCKTASRPLFTTDHIIFYHSLMSFGKQTPFKKLP